MTDAALDLGPIPTVTPPRPRRSVATPAMRAATASPLALPIHTARPVTTITAPLLNEPDVLPVAATVPPVPPQPPPKRRNGAECPDGRDRTARAVLGVLQAFPGSRVEQTTAGIRERVAVLAEQQGSAP